MATDKQKDKLAVARRQIQHTHWELKSFKLRDTDRQQILLDTEDLETEINKLKASIRNESR